MRKLASCVGAAGLGGCELLPQDATEWTIAMVATGVLLVAIVVVAIVAAKRRH